MDRHRPTGFGCLRRTPRVRCTSWRRNTEGEKKRNKIKTGRTRMGASEHSLTRIWLFLRRFPSARRFVQKITLSTVTWCCEIITTTIVIIIMHERDRGNAWIIANFVTRVLPLSKPAHNRRILWLCSCSRAPRWSTPSSFHSYKRKIIRNLLNAVVMRWWYGSCTHTFKTTTVCRRPENEKQDHNNNNTWDDRKRVFEPTYAF